MIVELFKVSIKLSRVMTIFCNQKLNWVIEFTNSNKNKYDIKIIYTAFINEKWLWDIK